MKKYSQMTAGEKRVAVAKDVIKQITVKKFKAKTGNYVKIALPKSLKGTDDIKKYFRRIKSCTVCAMGACLLSVTRFENKLKFNEVGPSANALRNDNAIRLFELFEPDQLMLIEQAFEGFSYDADRIADRIFKTDDFLIEKRANIDAFYHTYKSDRSRMIAIMKNIILNKGTFVL